MKTTWEIFHNPRCSKSRKALEILRDNNIEPDIIEYLKKGLDENKVEDMILKSKQKPKEFLRIKEKEFSNYKKESLETAKSVAKILAECPKLLERPIVIKNKQVIIARPPELIETLL